MYIAEVAELTPWTEDAIRAKIRRGELRAGEHYFQEGHRGRLIFKWDAIVDEIENGGAAERAHAKTKGRSQEQRRSHGKAIDVEETKSGLRRLLDSRDQG